MMNKYRFVAALLILIVLGGCSTKKNNFFSRTYHNISAHYNTWWNGNEAIKEGVDALALSAKDNFINILPVYKLGTKSEAASINSKADRAIEKAGIAIQRHSMFIRKKEHCKWIDDSYLMIGKAYFYKQDYYAAARTFDFTSSRYKGTAEATEALVWLIRTNTILKRFTKAQNTIEEFREMVRRGAVSKRVTKDYNLAIADFYCQQGLYNDAIPFLEEALWKTTLRAEKCRIAFILGQIYQRDKNFVKATEYFSISAKKGINYEYFINSKLNIAKCYNPAIDNPQKINRYLTKMVKEDKNIEYRDQIYFALSEIARLDKKYPEMANYLRKSIAASKNNYYQKYESSILLADYLFMDGDYVESKKYYDTAGQFLPQEYPNQKSISKKINMLINLGTQFVIVKDEDSLQRVARMPEEERNKLIDDIIAKLKKKQEDEKAKEERERRLAEMGGLYEAQQPGGSRPGGPGMPGMGKTVWYFYNNILVPAGISDFNKRWGNRKLEDLWRLKNKQVMDFDSGEAGVELTEAEKAHADSIQQVADSPLSRDMYLEGLPLKPEQVVASDEKIRDAFYAAANIFMDDLKDYRNAENTFDSLCTRFPDTAMNKHIVYSYYQIHKINKDKLKNSAKAEQYKSYIIEQFPETDYAKLLLDPEYYIMLENRKNAVSNLYKSAYDAYKSKNYFTVYGNTMIAETDYPEDPLVPKFKYLQALSMLKTEPLDSTAKVLQTIVSKYPSNDIRPSAESLLKSLVKLNPDHFSDYEIANIGTTDSVAVVKAKYVKGKKGEDKFSYVLLVDGSKADIDALKMRISDHNNVYRKFNNLSITAIFAHGDYYMLIVGNFDDDATAMDYHDVIATDDYIFSSRIKNADPKTFIISKKHFQEMYKNKDYEDYYKYFYKEYTK